jgi:heterotetrameric sarcosine oxidase gamma subunit
VSDDAIPTKVAAIGGAAAGHYGAETSGVTLAEMAIAAAWNVQGNPAEPEFFGMARRQFDVTLPVEPNTASCGEQWTAFWLGPKSWLLVAHAQPATDLRIGTFEARYSAFAGAGRALFDVSASRVAFSVSGAHAATVLAKSCPLDLQERSFAAGRCAQSVLGHVNALVYRPDTQAGFSVMVARSFARHVWESLCRSAAQYGYDVV